VPVNALASKRAKERRRRKGNKQKEIALSQQRTERRRVTVGAVK